MSQQDADLVLRGGAVYTVDAARSWAEAVAVRDAVIVAVGTDEQVAGLTGPRTGEVDLAGRMLLPGFIDAHVHASAAGLERLRCDLSDAHGLADYLAAVRAYAQANPGTGWITGGGWSIDVFPGGVASRHDLDQVAPDRPVFLSNRDHHAAWVNSKALELAGVTASTQDPADGRIEREPCGGPAGTLQEGAMGLVERVVPRPEVREQVDGILEGQRYLHALGITGWQEAIVGDYAVVPDCFDAYLEADLPEGSQPSPWPPVWLSALIEICIRGPSRRPSSTARCTPRSAPAASRTVVMPQSSVAARFSAAWKN